MGRRVILFQLASLLVATCALAQSPRDVERFQELVKEGKAAQAESRHEDAIAQFDRALAIMAHPAVKYLKAVSLQGLRRVREARALLLEVKGDPLVEKYAADIERRLREMEVQQVAVTLRTTPPVPARIHIDGDFRGVTPLATDVAKGSHTVMVRADGFRAVTEQLTVEPPGPVVREYALVEAAMGLLSIACETPGADVYVDNLWIASTPMRSPLRVEVGRHVVRVSKLGYQEQIYEVEVGGAPATVKADIARVAVAARRTERSRNLARALSTAGVAAGVTIFAVGTGFLVKDLVDRSRLSKGGERQVSPGNKVTLSSDSIDPRNAIVGGTLMGAGAATSVLTYFLFWPKD